MSTLKRIKKELKDIQKATSDQNKDPGYDARPTTDDNLYSWQGHICGPPGTPYHEGIFFLDIEFPNEYPFKPPKVVFQTKIYHMNINGDGGICLRMLKEDWSPATTLTKVLQELIELLRAPNADDPLVTEIAQLYSSDKAQHDKNALDATVRFAQ